MLRQSSRAVRRALSRFRSRSCNIYVFDKLAAPDGTSQFSKRLLFENIPCSVSFQKLTPASTPNTADRGRSSRSNYIPAARAELRAKLFVDPDLNIPPGSLAEVFSDGRSLLFAALGSPAVFPSHREYVMTLKDDFVR